MIEAPTRGPAEYFVKLWRSPVDDVCSTMKPPPATASAAAPPTASSAGRVSVSVQWTELGSAAGSEPTCAGPRTPTKDHPEAHANATRALPPKSKRVGV